MALIQQLVDQKIEQSSKKIKKDQNYDIGEHILVSALSAKRCVLCKKENKESKSTYSCLICSVHLHKKCFERWHQENKA